MTAITKAHPNLIARIDREREKKASWLMKQELFSPHFLAQDLNNEACSLISSGENVARAIHLLVRALELSKWSPESDNDAQAACSCDSCSLDSCLLHRDDEDDCDKEKPCMNRHRTRHHHNECNQHDFTFAEKKGFLYRRPLRVDQTCVFGNYYMGHTLTVMILFNLALAHQLLGMSIPPEYETFEAKMQNMDKALKLYELCVNACPDCNCSDAASLRLKLLVMNNLSQIHKLSGYPRKYRMCLEYLMRALMFVRHGREGGWDENYEILTPAEIDAIYCNMQSSSVLIGKQVHAAAA